jgi:acetyl/propionyl-CoA carboxylase alpha subunit
VVIDDKTREAMGAVALKAGRAVGYQNAGTVEFLWSKGEFFFLEMNTRLQVEHPVTEMVTGTDLVREQIRVAAGEKLGYGQDAIRWNGWAIEVRLNAEDPIHRFLPSTGTIKNLRMPGGPFVRLDLGMYAGQEVGLDYDPMLGKLIVWGPTRDEAIARMVRALQELNVSGVRTGAPAALSVLEDERFRRGEFDTHFLESLNIEGRGAQYDELVAVAAAIFRHHRSRRRALSTNAADRVAWLERSRRGLSSHAQRAGQRSAQDGGE